MSLSVLDILIVDVRCAGSTLVIYLARTGKRAMAVE
jgi:hypothetical protein